MRTPLRAAFRLALTGCLGLAAFLALATTGRAADPEKALPDSTLFFFKVKNVAELRESFKQTSFGQLLADPAMKPLKDDASAKLEEGEQGHQGEAGRDPRRAVLAPAGHRTAGDRLQVRPQDAGGAADLGRRRLQRPEDDRSHDQVDRTGQAGRRQGRHRVVQGPDAAHHPGSQGGRQAGPSAIDLDQRGDRLPHRHRPRRPQGPDLARRWPVGLAGLGRRLRQDQGQARRRAGLLVP